MDSLMYVRRKAEKFEGKMLNRTIGKGRVMVHVGCSQFSNDFTSTDLKRPNHLKA